jgi:homoserine O-acetyltransferase/O-succinyltransferase
VTYAPGKKALLFDLSFARDFEKKVYPDTGHFIHTDNPVEFAADVVDFITLGNVEPSPLAVDRLVNGTTTVGQAGAPAPSASGPSPTVGPNK